MNFTKRPYCWTFLVFNLLTIVIFYAPISELLIFSLHSELYSHIILVPLVSGYLIFQRRKVIFSELGYAFPQGTLLILLGSVLYFLGMTQEIKLNQNDYFSLMAFSIVIFWIGGFVLFYGIRASHEAAFPLLFLVFMIPIPTFMVEEIIFALQSASAEVSFVIFKVTGVPIFREGFIFHLPGISIEVAKQCSGIHSTIALLITSIMAGNLFLKTGCKKLILALSIFPITIFKNGLRIVTLSLLGAYVDEKILTESILHSRGGTPFFLLALVFLAPVLGLLMRLEKRASLRPAQGPDL